ncbi:hypothetical protein KKC91_11655 [bacterium]|nr:hypothetical protein [bacterium]
MINFVKKLLKKVIPVNFHPSMLVNHYIERVTGRQIFSGPFAGMKYVTSSSDIVYYPKILGTYEKELHELVEKLCRKHFNLIVNVGAGEGYYAVGFAVRQPFANIVAFEVKMVGQNLIQQMAKINGVNDRIRINGLCDHESLSSCLSICEEGRAILVVMDTEGAEDILLDPLKIPVLNKSYILVELHDFVCPGITKRIYKRFQNSHRITEIMARSRVFTDFPLKLSGIVSYVPKKFFLQSLYEARPDGMKWFYLEPPTMRRKIRDNE